MSKRIETLGILTVLLLGTALTGCAPLIRQGDQLFDSGRFDEAEVAYTAYMKKKPLDSIHAQHALYRIGLLYALPESPRHDEAAADRVFDRLANLDPATIYTRQAALLLTLRRNTATARRLVSERERQIANLRREVEQLRLIATETETQANESTDRAIRLRQEILRLEREMGDLQQLLDTRQEELRRLKEIDLAPAP